MHVLAFGDIDRTGVPLLAAALASLAVGLYGYGAFLLLARGYYALGDSRTPAVVAIAAAAVGVATMFGLAPFAHGTARVALLGFGHSLAYAVGAVVLGVGLSRRVGHAIVPRRLPRSLLVASAIGVGAWALVRAVDPVGRTTTLAVLVAVGVVGAALYIGAMHLLGDPLWPSRATRAARAAASGATAADREEMVLP
jgi:putative peptidoglycan lipid II flippase